MSQYRGNPALFNSRDAVRRAHDAAVAAEKARQQQETAESIGVALPEPRRARKWEPVAPVEMTEPVAPAIEPAPVAEIPHEQE